MAELGLTPELCDPEHSAAVISEFFARTMTLASVHFHAGRNLRAFTLADALTPILIGDDKPLHPDVDRAMRLAYEPLTYCVKKVSASTVAYRFRRSRLVHALDVLGSPVPAGKWEYLDGEKLPRNGRQGLLSKYTRPVLVRASMTRIDPSYANVVLYGSSTHVERGYMSHTELLCLTHYGEMRVKGVYVASNYTTLKPFLPIYDGAPVGPMSLSVGLLAEAYMHALMQRSPGVTQGYPLSNEKRIVTPRAVWLSAMDRFYCLSAAIQFDTLGFSVKQFGHGQVTVYVPRTRQEEACRVGSMLGMLPPAILYNQVRAQLGDDTHYIPRAPNSQLAEAHQ